MSRYSTEEVDFVASGYEWICNQCGNLWKEIEITDAVYCEICRIHYNVGEVTHAY